MAKKKNNSIPTTKTTETTEPVEPVSSKPYDLKTDAVERLVSADKKVYPQLTLHNDPRRKFKNSFLDRIPSWIKALFIKFWFNGAVCFFIFWGLGIFIPNMEDMILVLAISMGMVTDVLVNNIFRFFATVDGENDKWMMFPKKRYVNFFLNIIYAFVVLLVVIGIYNAINMVINSIIGGELITYVGVEPLLFGALYMGVDLLLILMKNTIKKIFTDAKTKNGVK